MNHTAVFSKSPKIRLTESELKLCHVLNTFTDQFNSTSLHNKSIEPLTLRITGGWVRDKLLGRDSNDIDIAVNIMSGEQFAKKLNKYLSHNFQDLKISPHNIHKIKKNPEKSKHLETASTNLLGIEIDFVNLRSEEYTELSRIPQIDFGTPAQDALRRDATLNALFYNIQSQKVEDFTEVGLQDLVDGVLRTPLPPTQTFLDDPLRILRLIRFASRFNFKIEPETLNAMSDPKINSIFYSKISIERIGTEMQKILKGPNPLIALSLIQKNNLENITFPWYKENDDEIKNAIENNSTQDEEQFAKATNKVDSIFYTNQLSEHLLNLVKYFPTFLINTSSASSSSLSPVLPNTLKEDPTLQQNFILAASLLPFSNLQTCLNPRKQKFKLAYAVETITKDGLKLNRRDVSIITNAVANIESYQSLVKSFIEGEKLQRSTVGIFLRSFDGNWQFAHFISLLDLYLKMVASENATDSDINILFQNYQSFYSFVYQENLQDSHNLKLLLDGKQISQYLKIKPGPWMKVVIDKTVIWQLENPYGTKDELLSYISSIDTTSL